LLVLVPNKHFCHPYLQWLARNEASGTTAAVSADGCTKRLG
jgi:hypothetical protein